MLVRGQRVLCSVVIRLASAPHRHIDFSMLVRVGLRMLGAQRGICRTIFVTFDQKSRMQMLKCLWHNLSVRRK
jgi:hypothetical protein